MKKTYYTTNELEQIKNIADSILDKSTLMLFEMAQTLDIIDDLQRRYYSIDGGKYSHG